MMPTRVLICEDEGLTALRYCGTLTRLGFETVGSAADGIQVIEAAARLQPDVILMDIEMPNLDGISAMRKIMETHPTAVVIISAYGEREMIEAALAAGAAGYLVKPVSDGQIEAAIQAALERYTARRWPGAE
jgi:two-component system, response regulator PdtaR